MNNPLLEAINKERDWLNLQPEFQPWDKGYRWVLEEINGWLWQETEFQPADSVDSWMDRCRLRVWQVWAHHWNAAASLDKNLVTDGGLVVQKLRNGERPGFAGALMGGDPLKDAILVEAFLFGVERAYQYVRQLYQEAFWGEKSRLGVSHVDYFYEPVWDLIHPIDAEPTLLSQFKGFSSLKTYLRVIVRHRLVDCLRKETSLKLLESRAYRAKSQLNYRVPRDIELAEFQTEVVHAIRGLTSPEQRLLLLKYCEGLPNRMVAQSIGFSEGYTSRLHRSVVDKLRYQLRDWLQAGIDDRDETFSLYAGFLLHGLKFALLEAHPAQEGVALSQNAEVPELEVQYSEVQESPLELRKSMGRIIAQQGREVAMENETAISEIHSRAEEFVTSPPLASEKHLLVRMDITPQDVFRQMKDAGERRPGVLLIDARNVQAHEIRVWLERLDCLQIEAEEQSGDDSLWNVKKVFFVQTGFDVHSLDYYVSRSDVGWFKTEVGYDQLIDFYIQKTCEVWQSILTGNGGSTLSPELPPNVVSVIELHAAPEYKGWQKRLLEMRRQPVAHGRYAVACDSPGRCHSLETSTIRSIAD